MSLKDASKRGDDTTHKRVKASSLALNPEAKTWCNTPATGPGRFNPKAQEWQPLAQPLFLVIRQELIKMKNMIIPDGWGEEEELLEM